MYREDLPTELQACIIPDWVSWLAQDADGCWWGYEVEPLQHVSGWYENEVGRNVRLTQAKPARNWPDKLHQLK